eukprot:CAMPEP_0194330186 /NCGR_PEP_ID=MMETSP0171-20130528/50921_1 /TAXON_ID=218684 /ORGANISM="Corethron pennatum, Strain L29A3" /LENGTH=156 /DNA_ID=CAMNT_0039091169 /DNA_START=181 /DNA_END=653 /DNA_ORIENTATION=-
MSLRELPPQADAVEQPFKLPPNATVTSGQPPMLQAAAAKRRLKPLPQASAAADTTRLRKTLPRAAATSCCHVSSRRLLLSLRDTSCRRKPPMCEPQPQAAATSCHRKVPPHEQPSQAAATASITSFHPPVPQAAAANRRLKPPSRSATSSSCRDRR